MGMLKCFTLAIVLLASSVSGHYHGSSGYRNRHIFSYGDNIKCCRECGHYDDNRGSWPQPDMIQEETYKYAICEVEPNPSKASMNDTVKGVVHFKQLGEDRTMVYIQLKGFSTTDENIYHGFHIHAQGSIKSGCEGAGSHYNPDGSLHGSPLNDRDSRHIGDLGNVLESNDGTVITHFTDDLISLSGSQSVMGRAVVIHEKKDDLGRGGDIESTKTGNAGARIACCVISAADGAFWGAN